MNPVYASISELFEYKPRYFIPKYQRAYSWEDGQIQDFITDVRVAFDRRYNGEPKQHFFGGVISVATPYPGTHGFNQFEVIDGQQRLSTFTLLANALISSYKLLHASTSNDSIAEKCEVQINDLVGRFKEFTHNIQGEPKPISVFEMSKRDNDFYRKLIDGDPIKPKKSSEFRLLDSYEKIKFCVNELVNFSQADYSEEDHFKRLILIEEILSTDFKVLHLVTSDRQHAYQLFQVINDRGLSLNDADLIRCKVLELLEGSDKEQEQIEEIWDNIVSYDDTENILIWCYESIFGKRPKQGALYDDFMSEYFGVNTSKVLNIHERAKILMKSRELKKDIDLARGFSNGSWPFSEQDPIKAWDRDRLSVLIEYLGNTASIPLLIAASTLDHRVFSDIVQMLERFFFRYKIICSEHNGPLRSVYMQETIKIRKEGANYNVESLRESLNRLIENRANDEKFTMGLSELTYRQSASKKELKHFLLVIEQYSKWFESGAVGVPQCVDKSKIFDRKEGMTLEHIYPKGLDSNSPLLSKEMEEIKNSVFNLTLLSCTENNLVGTEDFEYKRSVFQNSSCQITRELYGYPEWSASYFLDRKNSLLSRAKKIFIA